MIFLSKNMSKSLKKIGENINLGRVYLIKII